MYLLPLAIRLDLIVLHISDRLALTIRHVGRVVNTVYGEEVAIHAYELCGWSQTTIFWPLIDVVVTGPHIDVIMQGTTFRILPSTDLTTHSQCIHRKREAST